MISLLIHLEKNLCDVMKLFDPECRYVNNDSNSRQVAFVVSATMAPLPMFEFFNDRWGEAVIRRPSSGKHKIFLWLL